jgi:hypothetical protein
MLSVKVVHLIFYTIVFSGLFYCIYYITGAIPVPWFTRAILVDNADGDATE